MPSVRKPTRISTTGSGSSGRSNRQGSGGQQKQTSSRLHPDGIKDLSGVPKADTQIQHSTNAPTTGLPVMEKPVMISSNDSQLRTVSATAKPTGVPAPASPPPPPPKPKPAPPSKPVSVPKPPPSSDARSTTSTTPASKPAATPAANPHPPPTSKGPPQPLSKTKFQRLQSSLKNMTKKKDKPKAPSTTNNKSSTPPPVKKVKGAPGNNKTPAKKMFGNKSKVSPGKQKQGQRKKKKKVASKINKDGEFIPSNVQHQDETFINKPHSLLIDGVAKATTVHMTLTLGSQGQGRNDVLIYNIYDEKKRRLCTAQEISNLKGGSRPFLLTFMNDDKEVAFTLERAKNFILCCFGVQCCGSVGTVNKGTSSEMIGRIKQLYTCGKLQYEIESVSGTTVMFLEGPNQRFCLRNYIGKDTEFKVYVGSGTDPSKELCGDMRVYSSPKTFTDDPFIFTVRFLSLIEPERKVIILAAGTLLYLSYYENNPGVCSLYGNIFWLLILIILVAAASFVFVVAWILL